MRIEYPETSVFGEIQTPEQSALHRVMKLNDKVYSLEQKIRILKEVKPSGIRERLEILLQIRRLQAKLKHYKEMMEVI